MAPKFFLNFRIKAINNPLKFLLDNLNLRQYKLKVKQDPYKKTENKETTNLLEMLQDPLSVFPEKICGSLSYR